MPAYVLQRLAMAVLVAVTVSLVTFALLRLSGDPAVAMAGPGATAAEVESIRTQYGLDRPFFAQYFGWLSDALRGDFGWSYYLKTNVASVIADRLPVTAILAVSALSFTFLVAIPLGVVAAMWPNTVIDRVALTIALVGQAMPSFWFALILILYFGVYLQLLPITGSDHWTNFIMPSVVLGYYAVPAIMRLTRAGMLDVLGNDYIRTARAKGLLPFTVLFKHALRNAIIPVVSVSAVELGSMLGGSIVIEAVFGLNGLGSLAWQSIQRADFEMMQAIILVLACIYITMTFIADLLNAFLDPRIRVI